MTPITTFETLIKEQKPDFSVLTATKKDKLIVAAFLVIGAPLLILGGIGFLSHGGHTPLHLAIPKGGCISLVAVGGVMTIGGLVVMAAMMKRHFDFKKEALSVPAAAELVQAFDAPMSTKEIKPIYNRERPDASQNIGYYDVNISKAPHRLLIMNMHVYDSLNRTKNGLC